jgi:oxygen-independent coproporphyrinogen-3 oxidase
MPSTESETLVPETVPDLAATSAGAETSAETAVGSVFVSNYPPFSIWSSEALGELEKALGSKADPATQLGLYLHIPFCRKRCKFCYFRVYIDKNADQIQRYLDALGQEVETLAERAAVRGRDLRFVYFGGGTPSYIAVKHLKGLVGRIQAVLPWDAVEEVTFECEPGTLTESKVAAYREIGVTRLSLGIENFDDDILRDNGRAHVTREIDRCLPWIRDQGFDQLNVDLIAGMVGETWESWRDTVERTVDVDPDSVTIYQMELPYNTVYSQDILSGGSSPVADWETKRAWHLYAVDRLRDVGYEVSSAYTMVKRRPGREHQSAFAYRDSLWHGADLLGTGVASFGHLAGVHDQNVASWGEYLDKLDRGELPLGRAYRPTPRERLTRELILQMKLGRLELGYFRDKFQVDPLEVFADAFERLEDRRMLEVEGRGEVRLTPRGLLQVDSLLPEFYDPQYREARYT